jgi:hypothetical protein
MKGRVCFKAEISNMQAHCTRDLTPRPQVYDNITISLATFACKQILYARPVSPKKQSRNQKTNWPVVENWDQLSETCICKQQNTTQYQATGDQQDCVGNAHEKVTPLDAPLNFC